MFFFFFIVAAFIFVCFSMLGIESRASCMLTKHELPLASEVNYHSTIHRTQKNSQKYKTSPCKPSVHGRLSMLVWSSVHTLKQMLKKGEENTFHLTRHSSGE